VNNKYLKWSLFIFILWPSIVFGQRNLVMAITTVNDWGDPLPNVNIQIIIPEQDNDLSVKTDSNGTKIIVLKIKSDAIFLGKADRYQVTKMEFTDLNKRNERDTIQIRMVFKPVLSFSHGFTQLKLDSCICLSDIEQLGDTIRLYRYLEKSIDYGWYHMLIEREPDTYEIVNYNANGVQRGNVRPYPPIITKVISKDIVELHFRDNVKTYRVRGVENIHGFQYELIKD
jgi:hypothetical protein